VTGRDAITATVAGTLALLGILLIDWHPHVAASVRLLTCQPG
jgi:hypothetical protein